MNLFNDRANTPSDINQHMVTLSNYASRCYNVTEIGLGSAANAAIAFVEGRPVKLTSYDIVDYPVKTLVQNWADYKNVEWEYKIQDSTFERIEVTDFLFIDGLHSYEQVAEELNTHSGVVLKYIGFHDVVSFCNRNEDNSKGSQGIVPAIFDFMRWNNSWVVDYYSDDNNGLLILKRNDS